MGRTRFSTYAYILFLIIVIGTFASIAQNNYGVQLIALGCFGFTLTIFWRLYSIITTEKLIFPRYLLTTEYFTMGLIMVLFGFRALRIRFTAVEILFVVLVLIMALLYAMYFLKMYPAYTSNKRLRNSIILLYTSIVLFFLSLSFTFLNEQVSTILGAISFLSAILFLGWYYYTGKEAIFQDDRVNIFDEIFKYLNLSPIILSIILLISFYMGLFKVNVLPPIYTGEVPIRYMEMMNKTSETGNANNPEVYWKAYRDFLEYMEKQNEKES